MNKHDESNWISLLEERLKRLIEQNSKLIERLNTLEAKLDKKQQSTKRENEQ